MNQLADNIALLFEEHGILILTLSLVLALTVLAVSEAYKHKP